MKKVNIIVPCFNESQVIDLFFNETVKVISDIKDYRFEFIFIDDGSSDGTDEILKRLAENFDFVKYISFSRNFGKESAMYAAVRQTGQPVRNLQEFLISAKRDFTVL